MLTIPDEPLVATWEEWDDWHDNARNKYPVRYFLTHTLRYAIRRGWHRFIHQPWYWLKCRVWHRYNVVVCRKLPPTWVDRDYVMLHAAFQCLVDFVEKEEPRAATQTWEQVYTAYSGISDDPQIACPFASERANAWMEIKELYHWWKNCDPWDDDYENQNRMLHRLIDVRGYLWT